MTSEHRTHAPTSPTPRLPLLALILALLAPLPASAERIVGTEDDDDNSFNSFLIWRSQLDGTAERDEIHGKQGDDLLFGYGGDDHLEGGPGADELRGGTGDDVLLGGVGDRDVLYGGSGNDHYSVPDGEELVRELAGEGHDKVLAYVDYILPDHAEDVLLRPNTLYGPPLGGEGVAFFDDCDDYYDDYDGSLECRQLGSFAMGNDLDNEVRGNQMANLLDGLGGDDMIFGLAGDDELEGGPGDDVLAGFLFDREWASLEVDMLTGEGGADLFVTGFSGRPGGLWASGSRHEDEPFPQYLGQGNVYIMDFDWREGDKIEVYGNVDDYWIELGDSPWYGPYAAIYWDGSADGFSSEELIGYAIGITSSSELIPSLDFL